MANDHCLTDLVICDFDGTLVDTLPGILATFSATLEEAGFAVPPPAEVLPMIGLPLATMFRRFLPDEPTEELIDQLIAAYRARYHADVAPRTRPFPGVAETLIELRRAGLRLAVATSKLVRIVGAGLAASGLAEYFDLVLGNDSVERPKPAPDMVLKILADLRVPPERALVVGDSIHDVEMGRAAGVRTCAVASGVNSRAELVAAGSNAVVDRFEQLLPLLGLRAGS